MTGISLQIQWPPTSQSNGSVSQREQLVCHYRSNSLPHFLTLLQIDQYYIYLKGLQEQCYGSKEMLNPFHKIAKSGKEENWN
jgi:hypothetical protein